MNAADYTDYPDSLPDDPGRRDLIEEALRKERIEIARMLEADAYRHSTAAEEIRKDADPDDSDNEAWGHEIEADALNRSALLIRARTPAVAEPDDEPKF